MSEKYYSRLAANLILTRINEEGKKEILLQLRQNAGYMDNMYDFARNTIQYVANVIEDIKLGIQFDDGDFVNLKNRKR